MFLHSKVSRALNRRGVYLLGKVKDLDAGPRMDLAVGGISNKGIYSCAPTDLVCLVADGK